MFKIEEMQNRKLEVELPNRKVDVTMKTECAKTYVHGSPGFSFFNKHEFNTLSKVHTQQHEQIAHWLKLIIIAVSMF